MKQSAFVAAAFTSSKRNARAAEPTAAQGGGASPQRSATTALASLGAALHLPHAKDPFADTPRHVAKVEGTLVGKSGSAVEKVTEQEALIKRVYGAQTVVPLNNIVRNAGSPEPVGRRPQEGQSRRPDSPRHVHRHCRRPA